MRTWPKQQQQLQPAEEMGVDVAARSWTMFLLFRMRYTNQRNPVHSGVTPISIQCLLSVEAFGAVVVEENQQFKS
jgi:hypothetical protein